MGNKFKRQIIISSISLIMSVMLLLFASFAWLSSNREVATQGMQMQIDTTANLIISKSAATIVSADCIDMVVDFQESSAPYAACTHDDDYTSFPNGLKYLTNSNLVSFETGNLLGGETATWASAANVQDGTQFYIDKIVYIASRGKEIPSATLTAEIISATLNSSEVSSGPLMATSIDFYIDSVSSGNYKETVNVSNKGPVTLKAAGSTIPLNTEGEYITVVMRFYFDGALQDNSVPTKAYINSETITADSVNISVKFTATEPQA